MVRVNSWASGVRTTYERVASRFESGVQLLERRYTPLGRFAPGPFEGWSFLWQPALLGFVAMVSIVGGASFTNSPFKYNLNGTWFFGEPSLSAAGTPSLTKYILSVVLVYGGLLLLMRVWLRLAEVMKLHMGAPMRRLWPIFGLWSIPMIVAPPLFSRDVFSYAAQGEMTAAHISPYLYGPFTLGQGSNPWTAPVDPLWGNTPAPYGPFFLFIDSTIDRITGHHQLWTVVGLRILEVIAVIMIGYGVTMLARGLGRDPGEAFVLAAMNPLVLLTLIGGAHNDAIMTGFLVIGLALAVQRHPVWALFFVSLATAIKAPAAIGLAFVAWNWVGPHVRFKERIRPFAIGGVVAAAVLGVTTWIAGFGFGWVNNLMSEGTVRSWAAPATGTGMALTNLFHAVGLHSISLGSVLSVTRFLGVVIAVAFTLWLLWHSAERGWVRSLGLALLLFVILGPVVQPWYLAWGLVIFAASYKGREHFWLLLFSIIGPFIGLPGGRALLSGLVHSNPLLIALAVAILGGVLIVPMGRWTQWSWPEKDSVLLDEGPLDERLESVSPGAGGLSEATA
ncbi:MAG TPA: polyprenol phosphomannose-dependent alpha 1,6 mannosyltransferase MptB [Acidimicrobiales bacterium]|nr:polyprenol phosphomannose-dependent alpha 1,6 mannosyltransferase MptB [Acidimicrobiales bacterium]